MEEDLDGDAHLYHGRFIERVGDAELEGILAGLDEHVLTLHVTQLFLKQCVQREPGTHLQFRRTCNENCTVGYLR